tara:strand:- start:8321 stop:9175 length:855 start_codon:yes stop_codon:yes gene_type:complete
MSKSHNKKRNVGIIYELLLRNISYCLVNNDKKEAQKALKIVEKRFDKSTEIYKEFRLFNALAKSTVSDSAVAAAILTEAKQAAKRCNTAKLNKEKSLLIKDINYTLNDDSFYHRRIPEYKTYATIQTLLNDWRLEDRADFSRVIQYESVVAQSLLESKVEDLDIEKEANPDVDGLVVKIMTEKINKKYQNRMSEEQRELIREYVFSLSGNEDKILSKLTKTKSDSLSILEKLQETTINNIILEKIEFVKQKIKNESFDEINDESMSRILTLIQLKKEITEALDV